MYASETKCYSVWRLPSPRTAEEPQLADELAFPLLWES